MKNSLLDELGTPGRSQAHAQAQARGVFETINYFALMKLFGGRSELLSAPPREVALAALYLFGEKQAEQEEARRIETASKASSKASSSGGGWE